LLRKDFTALDVIHTFQGITIQYASLAGVETVKNKAYFSIVPRENKNFQSYYLLFDTCVARDAATTVCSKCLDGYHMQEGVANNTCWDYDEIPKGMGLTSQGFLLPCEQGCLGCKDNYMKCTECDESKGYILINGKCPSRVPLRLTSTRFNINTRIAKILFDAPLSIVQEQNKQFSLRVEDQVENINYSCGDLGCRLDTPFSPDNGFSITFDTDVTILKGQIIISKDSGLVITRRNDSYPFEEYPILVDIISLTGSNSTSKTTEAMFETLSQAQLPLTLLSIGTGPSLAVLADYLVAQFQYITLLEGPFLTFPEQVLSMSLSIGLMPFDVKNPFDNLALPEETCVPSYRFVDNDFFCSFVSNYGADFAMLMGILAVNIVISIATHHLKKYADSKQQTGLSRFANSLGRSLGLQYFLVKMEGNQMDIILVSLLNFYYLDRSTRLVIGLCLGLIMILFYVSTSLLQFFIGIKFWKAKESMPIMRTDSFDSLRAEESSVATGLPLDANDSVLKQGSDQKKDIPKINEIYEDYCIKNNQEKSKTMSLFTYVYDDFIIPKAYIWLNVPIANILRSFCLSMLLVAITGRPFHQMAVAMIVEAGYLLFIIKSNIKASRFEFYCECARTVLFILYILLKMISLADMTEKTRQTVVGRIMSIILLVVIGISISYALFCLISIVIDLSKTLKAKCTKKPQADAKSEPKAEVSPQEVRQPAGIVSSPNLNTAKRPKRVNARPVSPNKVVPSKMTVRTNPAINRKPRKAAE
jgi:hypothetical protein